ncbi:zinc-dependent peptidase [Comamonas endophytica]|uniref:Zinc-dependent peptidase n=1 Tax=Comamonas endophytica TaxID=2949090 RepID=A0ABY6G7X0_9BURK|nr:MULTISPECIES: M90 family metallopeptidase [unclassified Acidovorax]MCD2514552.1 zinc-dependent peptidase [Acidovorax sp. D4N7]UYG51129.1 zinc-dependent peptidase [Acidovorax sp. 5MLIR]
MSLRNLWNRLQGRLAPVPEIDAALWLEAIRPYPFLAALTLDEQAKLRALVALFLQRKQFHGAHGLEVTDLMALQIAAQACLPLLHWGAPREALAWYGDFVGIVVHPGEAVARRESVDEAGVVHHYDEVLLGEAMEGGPVMLSWEAVDDTRHSTAAGTSVVIHEFAHKIDMRDGAVDGCPPLPPGFMGSASARAARALWHAAWQPAYERFREQVIIAERFSGAWPWLDSYGATAPPEFFAVACEAYFVNRERFAQEFPTLAPQLAAFFQSRP